MISKNIALIKDSLSYIFLNVIIKGITFILLPFYMRVFIPSEFGKMELILTSIGFIGGILPLGIPQYLFSDYLKMEHIKKVDYYKLASQFYIFGVCQFLF